MIDYYQILGVSSGASVAEIHIAYRRAAKRCHPDMGGSQQQMVEVIAAWEVLSDGAKRDVYDAARSSEAAAAQAKWRSVGDAAARKAAAVAAAQVQSWERFVAWVDETARDSDTVTTTGRRFGGAVSGSIIAAVIGLLIGRWAGLGAFAGALTGLAAGALGGFFAGKSLGMPVAKS